MKKLPFTLVQPVRRTTPIIFSSPHSGRDYPRAFRRQACLGQRVLRSSEDAFVDLLFANMPRFGAPLLCATWPRAYLDLNRGADELDPALIHGMKQQPANPRIASGLGVVPRVVSGGREIYRGKLLLAEVEERIRTIWKPFHQQLEQLLTESMEAFGQAILIDCHSMPHEALQTLCRNEPVLPEIVLGDRYGTSATEALVSRIEAAFQKAGFRVARNKPFAGAYIAQHYGRPAHGRHVVQIEIDRSLYMNELTIRPNNNFASLKATIEQVMSEVIAGINVAGGESSLAAE